MKVELTGFGCTLTREPGDKRISHESTVGYHMKRLLNAAGGHKFVRMDPRKNGLTDCRVGLWDKANGIMLWHERYQIEDAAKAFNAGEVFFQRIFVEAC